MVNKKAFVTLLVLVGLVLIISRSPVEFEEVMPALQTSTLNPSNLTAQSVLLASTVRDLDFYRQLMDSVDDEIIALIKERNKEKTRKRNEEKNYRN